ncbi:hypothetical protein ACHAQA_003418 [Verticillium albo-atrum]
MKFTLLVLPLIAPIFAAPVKEWEDDMPLLEGRGYIVPSNITIEPFEKIDPTSMGISLAVDRRSDNAPAPDVESLHHGIEARAKDVETTFFIGSKRAEYGCKQMVRPIIQQAIDSLCRDGACDEGSSYYHEVDWSGQFTKRANVKVDVKGSYNDGNLQKLADAAKSMVIKEAFTSYEKQWRMMAGRGASLVGRCEMTRFPNFIKIVRRVDGGMEDMIDILVTPPEEEKEDYCMVIEMLKAMASAIKGVAGDFFGIVPVPEC